MFTSNCTSVRVNLAKPDHFDHDLVGAWSNLDELIFAALVGGDGAVEAGAGIAQRYDGAGDDPALRIGYRAAKQGGGLRKAAESKQPQ